MPRSGDGTHFEITTQLRRLLLIFRRNANAFSLNSIVDVRRRHNLLPVGSKSHKRVNHGSCSGRDVSITAQPISKKFTVL